MKSKYYTYFKLNQSDKAKEFEKELLKKDYTVTRKLLDYGGGQWSVIAIADVEDTDDIYVHEEMIESIADKYDGEYDGNEVGV